jgi:hypothetical protein
VRSLAVVTTSSAIAAALILLDDTTHAGGAIAVAAGAVSQSVSVLRSNIVVVSVYVTMLLAVGS